MKPTVPPAVEEAFNNYSQEICDRAELDREDKVRFAGKIQKHLEKNWRDGIEEGLSTEEAQQRAIKSFGSVESVAHSLGGCEAKTIILNENNRVLRLIWFTSYCAAVFMVRVMVDRIPNRVQTIIALPEFLGKGFVALAIFYLAVRIWRIGLSMDNSLKVHAISPMLMKLQKRFPTFYDRWCPVFTLVGRGSGDPSVLFKCALSLLQGAGLVLALYLTRDFMMDFIVVPYNAIFHHWGHKIPAFENYYYLYMSVLLLVVWVQGFTILVIGAELFEWWQDKRFTNNKYLHWVMYIFPSAMKVLLFPSLSEHR